MTFKMIRKQDQALIVTQGQVADTFLSRLQGLIGKNKFAIGEALLFPKNNSVHMWMMSIPIDVLFLKKQGKEWEVMKTVPGLKPWKLLPVACITAHDTLELPAGTIEKFKLQKGETLCFA